MAVGIVVGAAFTDLIKSFVSDWITPLIGAIFQGGDFNELTFSVNGSTFFYGHFINVFIYCKPGPAASRQPRVLCFARTAAVLMVCIVVYFLVVLPINKLMARVNPGYLQQKRPDGCPSL
ncbi:hypothetical protein CHLNCDRAFT_136814 [Chlorella variabilis]|uniref:Large conductance mechanosensitive channel protein n=1 Tax=Chlorella variabilis TaxID=554065 RepID=E1ZL45_CHLVA|nr:hypothetical protein CHLNCDRAFT_136814 [Chlorella variabilis]EFN53497.1 hypothetical protein CHLNCDRAFT_136814 [Chlorella variabilis]|eukprot:XP_005845599.1 hypothetical protein CHLNCDRAFT_136814 [Chlorella variabilis]